MDKSSKELARRIKLSMFFLESDLREIGKTHSIKNNKEAMHFHAEVNSLARCFFDDIDHVLRMINLDGK